MGGWIFRNGRHTRVVRAIKLTRRDPLTLQPVTHDLELYDEEGECFRINGTVEASSPSGFWPNVKIHMALVQWKCEARAGAGWGDSQECQWTDFIQGMRARSSTGV